MEYEKMEPGRMYNSYGLRITHLAHHPFLSTFAALPQWLPEGIWMHFDIIHARVVLYLL
jgi:hypothetical protein